MPTLNVFDLTIAGTTKEDLDQWCSHHLSNRFSVRSEVIPFHERSPEQKKTTMPVPMRILVHVVGDKDRLRVREAFDVAHTKFSRQFFSEDEVVEH